MRLPFQVITTETDSTQNFEAIQSRFGVPVFDAAPANPQPGQMYFDSTLDAASSPALGYWGPVRGWSYV